MFWPFARVLGDYEEELAILCEAGIDWMAFADAAVRIPKPVAQRVMVASMWKARDPALGLHAGEGVEISDFGPIDQTTRYCATLRDAVLCASRYTRLHDEGVQVAVLEEGDRAELRISNGEPRPAVVNEFQVASTLKRLGFFVRHDIEALEVRMTHAAPTDAAEYARVFRAPARLGAEHNAIVVPRTLLDTPARRPNPALLPLFEEQAKSLMRKLEREATFAQRVRDLVEKRLPDGPVGIRDIARHLHLSEATLRRRLSEEHTTHRDLLDGVRRQHALSYVEASRGSLGEIGYRLGFSSPSAFGRAFRRWVGTSPIEYRARQTEVRSD